MIKWKSKHRQEGSSSSALTTSLPLNGRELLPKYPDTAAAPVSPDFVDLGADASPQTTPKPSPRLTKLIVAKDIEALLEEDERARTQERHAQQERVAGPGKLDHSSSGGLPPPPRPTLRSRQYKNQSEHDMPMSSGRSSNTNINTGRGGNKDIRRPSTTGGSVSPASVSRRASINDAHAQIEPIRAPGTGQPYSYTMLKGSPPDDGKLETRLSEFGPRPSRRSLDGPDRESWGSSDFSDTFPTTFADASRTLSPFPPRPFLSHGVAVSSRESVYSLVSSIDPASTAHEPRISVSSTIYPTSEYNELPSPVAAPVGNDQLGTDHRDSPFYTEADLVHVDDQLKSIIDTSSPTSAELGTPVPQSNAFPGSFGVYSNNDAKCEKERAASPRRSLPSPLDLDVSSRRTSGPKPALPTAPKPDFRRSRSAQPSSKSPMISKPSSRSSSPKLSGLVPYHLLTSFSPDTPRDDSLPPTTNYLSPQERADLIRKSRKLTRVFGQTPSPMSASEDLADSPVLNNCLLPVAPSRKSHPRGALSVPDTLQIKGPKMFRGAQSPMIDPDRTDSLSPIRFRRSSSARGNDSDDSLSPYDSPDAPTPRSSQRKIGDAAFRSPTVISACDSFIDMTAEQHGSSLMRFPSLHSLADSLTEEQKAEEERRRKRERLAKLHRFLGSRVPMELVLGPGFDVPLPPVAITFKPSETASDGEASPATKLWSRSKRRNSLASSDPHQRLPDSERLKEELSDKEKAIVVKRAQKMERLFGEQPPQDLFHSAITRPALNTAMRAVSNSKLLARSAPSSPSSPVGGNVNKSAYQKHKLKRNNRPGTAESSRQLLDSSFDFGGRESVHDGQSDVYYHYRNSLVSLTNIVDNDDKRSLVELHEYINDEVSRDKRESHSNSIRSERRRSLPLRASYSSLNSQYTISEVKLEVTPFEVRRRRAAKLSQFFGVSYRDLFGEVLDSLEMSVREDEGKGTLNADQAKDLLVQLTKLKARQNELS